MQSKNGTRWFETATIATENGTTITINKITYSTVAVPRLRRGHLIVGPTLFKRWASPKRARGGGERIVRATANANKSARRSRSATGTHLCALGVTSVAHRIHGFGSDLKMDNV